MIADLVARLHAMGIETTPHFSFREHTTIGIGGDAPLGIYPASEEQFIAALRLLQEEGARYVILGNGSNVLASDGGFGGAVISTVRLDGVRVEGERVIAQCGAPVMKVLRIAAQQGLGGASFLEGIPATVGGAVFMNAGAGGRYIAERIESVKAYRGGVERICVGACKFSYKHSLFMEEGCAILSATLRCARVGAEQAQTSIMQARTARDCLPVGRSMGCVFQNPAGLSAGELIDRAGLKGVRCGAAYISERHANFIINGGGATARQVRTLIEQMRAQVYRRFGIKLKEEIRTIGDEDATER